MNFTSMIKSLFNVSGSNIHSNDIIVLQEQIDMLITSFDDLCERILELSCHMQQNSEMISTLAKVQFDLACDYAQAAPMDEGKKSSFSILPIDDDDDLIN